MDRLLTHESQLHAFGDTSRVSLDTEHERMRNTPPLII